jgi:RNA polymerase sigma-70 factor (ECF subfamily)
MDVAPAKELWPAGRAAGTPPGFVEGGRPFEEFYRAEVGGLVALARGLCPPSIAEDIAQEAMLVAYRRWSEVQELDHPEAYVRRTCANMAVSQFRRRMAELRAFGRTRRQPEALADPDHEAFWALVRLLPRRQAQSVALHYLYDLSVADVAATLGIAEGSVKVHLSRAREALARQIVTTQEEPS